MALSEREMRLNSAVGSALKLKLTECNVRSTCCRGRREAVAMALSEREIRLDSAVGPVQVPLDHAYERPGLLKIGFSIK